MLKKYISRFPHAVRGIIYASRFDFGFKTQLYGIATLLLVVLYFLQPLTQQEIVFVLLGYFLILITELQNSALEVALDHLHPETAESLRHSKDMAAGAVLLAGIFLAVVVTTLILARL